MSPKTTYASSPCISTKNLCASSAQPAQDRLQALLRDFNHCIILGDFNVHHTRWDHNMRQNKRGKEMAQICRHHNLTVLNTPNIHTAHNQHQNKKNNTIDLAISTEHIATRDFISLSVTEAPVQSKHHHSPIIANIKTSINDHPITNQKIISKCNWEKFRNSMNQTCRNLPPPAATTSLEELDNHIAKFTQETARNL